DLRDVRMVQRREHLHFALEAHQTIGVIRQRFRQDLDCDRAIQLPVPRAIDLAHSAGTDRRDDLVWTQAGTWRETHWSMRIIVWESRSLESLPSSVSWPSRALRRPRARRPL